MHPKGWTKHLGCISVGQLLILVLASKKQEEAEMSFRSIPIGLNSFQNLLFYSINYATKSKIIHLFLVSIF